VAKSIQQITGCLLGLVGGVVGGILGYYTFQWVYNQGFYGMMIPGAFVGLGCGLLSSTPSHVRGAVCAAAALGLGLFTEWRFFPFNDDGSMSYFLKNVPSLKPLTVAMIAAGGFFAYWLGKDAGFRLWPGKPGSSNRND
jgi:hypothetical protein